MNLRKLINYSKIGSRLLAHKFKKKTWPVSVSLHVTRFAIFHALIVMQY